MSSTMKICWILLMALALLSSACIEAANSRPPRNNDISNMADALKYLQDLDTYYGDRARVRFGKRAPYLQYFRNRLADGPEMTRNSEFSAAEEPF